MIFNGNKREPAAGHMGVSQWLLCASLLCPPVLLAQTSKPVDPRCKAGSKSAACVPSTGAASPGGASDAPAKSAGSAFPFPTDDSKRGANVDGSPQPAAPLNGLPAMPTDAVPDPPASSERPLHLPPGSGSTSSSSSSDDAPGASSSRSDDDDVAPTTADPNAPVKASALKDLGSRADMSLARAKLEETRVTDDLKVGSFYMKDGNAQGAYLRFKDAVDHAPDDFDARFSLAEAASKLNKRDEAVLNYREYLRLDPGGDHEKQARKALGKLGGAAN